MDINAWMILVLQIKEITGASEHVHVHVQTRTCNLQVIKCLDSHVHVVSGISSTVHVHRIMLTFCTVEMIPVVSH